MFTLTPHFFRIERAVFVVGFVCLLTAFTSIIFVAASNDSHVSATTAGPTVVTNTNNDGAYTVTIRAHTSTSNPGTIRIDQ